MLALNNIEVVYDGVILVLRGVSLFAEEGHITTLLGANGAGKTTTLKAISGLLRTERGEVADDVAGPAGDEGLAGHAHDGDGRLGGDAVDLAEDVAVEHEVADDQELQLGEATFEQIQDGSKIRKHG